MFCLSSPSVVGLSQAGSGFTSGETFMQGKFQFNGKIYNSLPGLFSQFTLTTPSPDVAKERFKTKRDFSPFSKYLTIEKIKIFRNILPDIVNAKLNDFQNIITF